MSKEISGGAAAAIIIIGIGGMWAIGSLLTWDNSSNKPRSSILPQTYDRRFMCDIMKYEGDIFGGKVKSVGEVNFSIDKDNTIDIDISDGSRKDSIKDVPFLVEVDDGEKLILKFFDGYDREFKMSILRNEGRYSFHFLGEKRGCRDFYLPKVNVKNNIEGLPR